MTLQEFKRQCEEREELRERWSFFASSALAFRGERLSLARARVTDSDVSASRAFDDAAVAFAQAKKELVAACSEAGVQIPDLTLEAVCDLFY